MWIESVATGVRLDVDAAAGEPAERVASGLLVAGELQDRGLAGFALPATPRNRRELAALIHPDAPRPRPAFLAVRTDLGPHDRLRVVAADAERIECRLTDSRDPLALAARTRLVDLDLGDFYYDRASIAAAQARELVGPDDALGGVQFPLVQFGQIAAEATAARRPHAATPHLRPHVNPHWLLRRALSAMGFALRHPYGDTAAARRECAYLLRADLFPAHDPSRESLTLKALESASGLPLGNAVREPIIARDEVVVGTPVASRGGLLVAPRSGVYRVSVRGAMMSYRVDVEPDPEDTRVAHALTLTVTGGARRFALEVVELTASSIRQPFAPLYEFRGSRELWLSQGQVVTLDLTTLPNHVALLSPRFTGPAFGGALGTADPDDDRWREFHRGPEPSQTQIRPYTGHTGLEVVLERVAAWYDLGSIVPWNVALRPELTVLDLAKGVAHLCDGRIGYDPVARALTILPASGARDYGGEAVAGYYRDEPTGLPAGAAAAGPGRLTFDASERPDRVEVGFAGEDHAGAAHRGRVAGAARDAGTYRDANPLFHAPPEVTLRFPVDGPSAGPGDWRVPRVRYLGAETAASVPDATALAGGGASDRGGVAYDVDPYLVRYWGVGSRSVRSGRNIFQGLVRAFDESILQAPAGSPRREYAYAAAGVPRATPPEGAGAYGPPLTYAGPEGLFAVFWAADFLSRYAAVEFALPVTMDRYAARAVDFAALYAAPFEGRATRARLVAVEDATSGPGDNVATLRFVAAPATGHATDPAGDCAANAAHVTIAVGDGVVSAEFALVHGAGDLPLSVEYAYLADGSSAAQPRPYTPGEEIDYFGYVPAGFSVLVTYPRCPPVYVRAFTGVYAQQVPCGDAPALTLVYDVGEGYVRAVRGPGDATAFTLSDVLEVDVDGAGWAAYTEGEVVGPYASAVFRRTARRSAACDAVSVSVAAAAGPEAPTGSGSGETPRPPCRNAPTLTARAVGAAGVAFEVAPGPHDSPGATEILVRPAVTARWAAWLGGPAPAPGRVMARTTYATGCPPVVTMRDYDAGGALTAVPAPPPPSPTDLPPRADAPQTA